MKPGLRWYRDSIRPSTYVLQRGDVRVAEAALTGRPGVDNYPWEWYTSGAQAPDAGVADTLRDAKVRAERSVRGNPSV